MEKPSFEERLASVKLITERIEGGQLPLNESVQQFETGIQTLKELEKELEEIKRKITVLREETDGSVSEYPLKEEK